MISKEKFISLILNHQTWNKRIEEVSDILDTPSLFDCDWIEYSEKLFSTILKLIFNNYAVDDIEWWLYEKSGNPELKMWDSDGNEIPTETVEDLWNIVKDNQNDNIFIGKK